MNSYDYDVWGNFLKKEETIENHFTYFGQTYDEETGLYYLRARYYDPTTGRFTQQDPAEDGYNWYVYGNQNPVTYIDPSGNFADWIVIALYGYAQAVITSPDLQYDMQMLAYDISQGDYVSAAFGIVDILAPGFSGSKMVPKFIRKYFDELYGWIKNIEKNADELPKGWSKITHGEFTHIKDTEGRIRIRIDPPDARTPYAHKHIYDAEGNSLDISGNIVSSKSKEAHIPLN